MALAGPGVPMLEGRSGLRVNPEPVLARSFTGDQMCLVILDHIKLCIKQLHI